MPDNPNSYDMDSAFKKVFSDIQGEQDQVSVVKKKEYTDMDYILLAFMSLLKAFMSVNKEKTPPTTIMGA